LFIGFITSAGQFRNGYALDTVARYDHHNSALFTEKMAKKPFSHCYAPTPDNTALDGLP